MWALFGYFTPSCTRQTTSPLTFGNMNHLSQLAFPTIASYPFGTADCWRGYFGCSFSEPTVTPRHRSLSLPRSSWIHGPCHGTLPDVVARFHTLLPLVCPPTVTGGSTRTRPHQTSSRLISISQPSPVGKLPLHYHSEDRGLATAAL